MSLIDGKQAGRTSSSPSLAMLFDHGLRTLPSWLQCSLRRARGGQNWMFPGTDLFLGNAVSWNSPGAGCCVSMELLYRVDVKTVLDCSGESALSVTRDGVFTRQSFRLHRDTQQATTTRVGPKFSCERLSHRHCRVETCEVRNWLDSGIRVDLVRGTQQLARHWLDSSRYSSSTSSTLFYPRISVNDACCLRSPGNNVADVLAQCSSTHLVRCDIPQTEEGTRILQNSRWYLLTRAFHRWHVLT